METILLLIAYIVLDIILYWLGFIRMRLIWITYLQIKIKKIDDEIKEKTKAPPIEKFLTKPDLHAQHLLESPNERALLINSHYQLLQKEIDFVQKIKLFHAFFPPDEWR